jgi:anti-sigma B factor antagonist
VQIGEARHGEVVVLRPDAALQSAAEVALLDGRLRTLMDGGTRGLVLDCSDVSALGSAAVRVLLRASRKLAAGGGRLLLVSASERLRRALAVSGFDKDFAVASDLSEALATASAGLVPVVDADTDLCATILRVLGAPALPPPSEADRQALLGLREAVLRALVS